MLFVLELHVKPGFPNPLDHVLGPQLDRVVLLGIVEHLHHRPVGGRVVDVDVPQRRDPFEHACRTSGH